MSEFFENIYSNPFSVIIALIFFYYFLKLYLVIFNKFGDSFWNRIEYIWIIIGFLGVMTLVNENWRNKLQGEIENSDRTIVLELGKLKESTFKEIEEYCPSTARKFRMYRWSNPFSKYFEEKNHNVLDYTSYKRQLKYYDCSWLKMVVDSLNSMDDNFEIITVNSHRGIHSMREKLDRIEEKGGFQLNPTQYLTILPDGHKYEDELAWVRLNNFWNGQDIVHSLDSSIAHINTLISNRNDMKDSISDSFSFGRFKNGIGVILVIMAFALRLLLVTHRMEKRHESKT